MSFFLYYFLLEFISGIIVFPFKTVIKNQTDNIDSNYKEYNYSHFINDYFNKLIYIQIKIGNPPQEVNTIISYNDCNFKIGQAKNCIYSSEYLSYYNRNISKDFKYTDYYTFPISEFKGFKGHSAEETIFAYTDLNLNNFTNFKNIGFYLGSDTNESLCGIIGLRMPNYATFCKESNNIIESFKSREIINNYQWILNYTSENEGFLILGANISQLISNFDENNLYKSYSIRGGSDYPWMIKISKIECGENNYTINYNEINAQIDNDYSLFIGGNSYMIYIENNYFSEYIYKNICIKNLINYNNENIRYHIIECDKEKFSISDIKKYPKLSFKMRSFDKKFIFEGKDLFIETKYKFFFSIIYSYTWRENWIFGKIFLRKYPTIIDLDTKLIQIYNNYNNENNDASEKEDKKEEDNSIKLSGKFLFIIILIIIALICIFSILFYFLGKNLNKIRKKKANELNDEYDYTLAGEKSININKT